MSAEQPTSTTLLDRVKARDPVAWRRLMKLYAPLVRYWCAKGGARGPDADDVSQDVFHAVSQGLEAFRRDRVGDGFRGWLRGITRHKLLDHYRRKAKHPVAQGGTDAQQRFHELAESELDLGSDDPPEQLQSLYHRALELVRGEFEPQTWSAFWRVTVDGHAPNDIAAELGVTPAAIRKAKSRVLRRLREEVGDLIT